MITFVGNDAEGLPLKRKQSQRACETCRKRKKRCPHQPLASRGSSNLTASSPLQPPNAQRQILGHDKPPASSRQARTYISRNENDEEANQLPDPASTSSVSVISNAENRDENEEHRNPRFIGDLNPEGTFVTCTSTTDTPDASSARSPEDVVGVWVSSKLLRTTEAPPGPLLPVLLPYLETACLKELPIASNYDAIYRLYLDEIHPILPLINLEAYQQQLDMIKTLLKLAICLMTCGNPKTSTYLGRSSKDFTTSATQLLRAAIDNGLVRDKQIAMQLFIVLAMANQLSDDRHASAEFASRAISYAHTYGLHLDSTRRSDNSYVTRLFCCLFVLDRLNAAVQGRPVLMHERDLGRDLDACIKQQDSLFQLTMRVVLLLDKVIALYRPPHSNELGDIEPSHTFDLDFPTFEDLLAMCGTIRVPPALVATVEILYHAVAVLSCRSQSMNEPSRNSVLHTRQSLSAASIVSIAGDEFRGQLSMLPFVPYSMSLALRVSYRDLRLSKSSFTRTRARRQLLHICSLLRTTGDVFPSSLQMAELAEQTVHEMDKAWNVIAGQRRASTIPVVAESMQAHGQAIATGPPDHDLLEDVTAREATANSAELTTSNTVDILEGRDTRIFDGTEADSDFNVFDYLDSNFDIQAIDAALADSMGPFMPMDTTTWNFVT